MFLIGIFLLLSANVFGVDDFDEGKHFAEELIKKHAKSNEEKEVLRGTLAEIKLAYPHSKTLNENNPIKGKCLLNAPISLEPETSLYIFVSFSMPDDAWLLLSKEVEKTGGIFVLRGLPNNSFKQLAEKLYALRLNGVNATVQVDPRLFHKYNIEKVPSFVTVDENDFDKLSGNVTLAYALEKMNNPTAKSLRSLL